MLLSKLLRRPSRFFPARPALGQIHGGLLYRLFRRYRGLPRTKAARGTDSSRHQRDAGPPPKQTFIARIGMSALGPTSRHRRSRNRISGIDSSGGRGFMAVREFRRGEPGDVSAMATSPTGGSAQMTALKLGRGLPCVHI
jgi:hypothetical protein